MKRKAIIWAALGLLAAGCLFISCENALQEKTCTVSYDADGGEGTVPAKAEVKEGGTITAAAAAGLTKSGYLFGGWNTRDDGSGTTYATGASITVTEDITLYAQWKSTNANLSTITPSAGTLSPVFNTNTTAYTVNVANSVESITVTGEAADSTATVGGDSGETKTLIAGTPLEITIRITAQDGTTTKDYTVKVTRFSLPAGVNNTMVPVTGGTVTGVSWASTSNYPLPQTIADFTIGQTEVTYELWYAVRTWAISNGYALAAGREGNDGADGAAPTTAKQEPVTNVSWRDAVVWCNAYSEAVGKTAVYYENDSYTTVLRVSEGYETADGSGKAENAKIKADANGFRLPTEAEWEYAARGGTPGAGTPWTYTYAGSNTIGDVAVYWDDSGSSKTAEVKSKAANTLGLYDMSGNVWEWCWDSRSSYRVHRGGCFGSIAANCAVADRVSDAPSRRDSNFGLRVGCSSLP